MPPGRRYVSIHAPAKGATLPPEQAERLSFKLFLRGAGWDDLPPKGTPPFDVRNIKTLSRRWRHQRPREVLWGRVDGHLRLSGESRDRINLSCRSPVLGS